MPVILYSTSLHCWEVWSNGRPVGHGTLGSCRGAYPTAAQPSDTQFRLEHDDT